LLERVSEGRRRKQRERAHPHRSDLPFSPSASHSSSSPLTDSIPIHLLIRFQGVYLPRLASRFVLSSSLLLSLRRSAPKLELTLLLWFLFFPAAEWTTEPAQPPSPAYFRILYRGRMLDDDSTLACEFPSTREQHESSLARSFPSLRDTR